MFFEKEIKCSLVSPYATHSECKEAYQLFSSTQVISSSLPIFVNPKICAGFGSLNEFFLEGAVQLGVVGIAHEQAPKISREL